MKRLPLFFTLYTLFSIAAAVAQPICYGYAPRTLSPDVVTAHGTAMNNFIEAGICLDPAADPLLADLKGSKVVGVRCYLRADYKQKSKKWSSVWVRTGSLTAEPTAQYENFTEGWNEVYFATPVEMGDAPLYVGYQVFELKGTPYPIVCYSKAAVNDGCFINMAQEGFIKYENRGTLLVEAIIEPADPTVTGTAFVQASGAPMAVAPGTDFDCTLYARSQTGEAISSLEVTTTADEGASVKTYTVEFDTPIPAFDGTFVPFRLCAPTTEGESVPLRLEVTAVNGVPCRAGKANTINLYVSEDAFVRMPLVEEFTGLACVNCPFMVYYLDQAIEPYAPNLVYVTHHAGFLDDRFTLSEDKALLYLFGGPNTYNPAAMFDRRVLKGESLPIISAKEASKDPYTEYIEQAMAFPAKANVEIEAEETDGVVTCHVRGKIAKAMIGAIDGIRLTAYLVEDDIRPTGNYAQKGVTSDVAEDAPKDMVEKFRHNGLIRIAFTENTGSKLDIDENGYFDVVFTKGYIRPLSAAKDTYQEARLDASWVKKNLRAVAFVHKMNQGELDIEDNFVLNATHRHLSGYDAIESVRTDSQSAAAIHDLQGRRLTSTAHGIYIIGNKKVVK